jgi:SAM-dependent methyltransferase
MPKNLELGCGTWIRPGLEEFEHHGFIKHSNFISYAHDLNITPWPWPDNEWDNVYAIDVMQMLDIKIIDWLREAHRILKPGGIFLLRLPAFDNPEAWRDPVDKRVYHPDSMYYFDPSHELYQKFSLAYWENIPQFKVTFIDRRADNFVYQMIKI